MNILLLVNTLIISDSVSFACIKTWLIASRSYTLVTTFLFSDQIIKLWIQASLKLCLVQNTKAFYIIENSLYVGHSLNELTSFIKLKFICFLVFLVSLDLPFLYAFFEKITKNCFDLKFNVGEENKEFDWKEAFII